MTRKELTHKIRELKAQLASTYYFASIEIQKLGTDKLTASGVLVCLYHIGGEEASIPFMVKDGFSKETIDALHADINRSYELAVMPKPVRRNK